MQSTIASGQSHHLPQQFTTFVGREKELADISERLADPTCRLLTLVGPGGMGKTRLAIETTAIATVHFPDGTYFVNLQSITKPEFLIVTIAEIMGLSLSGKELPLRQLCRYLADKRLLLTLDNFEQLLDRTDIIMELLHQTAVTILITSREPLNLQEEWLYPVYGLSLTDTETGAVQLFVERARRVQPQFNLANEQPHVIKICQFVEGMPLAIELAAAWTRSLPCTDILKEIQSTPEFLSTQVRNVPERHRSIYTIFEQTWQQLTETEQAVFRRLSVFYGGFRREAATAVAGASLPILSDLIDKSLLHWETDNRGNGRYQIHELLSQFAAEKLDEHDAEAAETRKKHTQYYAAFLQERLDDLLGNKQVIAIDEIQADIENMRYAWQQMVDTLDFSGLEQASNPLTIFYWHRSRFLEGRDTFSHLVNLLNTIPPSPERDAVLAMALHSFAQFMMILGELEESSRLAAASQRLYETHQLPPPPGMDTDPRLTMANNARLLGNTETAVSLAQAALKHNQRHNHLRNSQEAYRMLAEAQIGQQALDEAWQNAEKSYVLAEETNELSRLAYTHETLGAIAFAQGKNDVAAHHFQESYAMWAQLGYDIGRADMLQRLGDLALDRQAYTEASNYYEKSLPLFEEGYVSGGVAGTLIRLGETAVSLQEYETAREHYLKAIPIILDFPNQFGELTTRLLLGIAQLLLTQNDVEHAVPILAYLVEQPQQEEDRMRTQKMLKGCQAQMEETAYKTAVTKSQSIPLEIHLTNLQNYLATPFPDPLTPTPMVEQPLIDPLTPRELEVLQLIADGLSNQEIADELFISKGTVKYYSSHIYSKLQVANRTHAVAAARELGILKA